MRSGILAAMCVLICLAAESGSGAEPTAASKTAGGGGRPDSWEISGVVVDEAGKPFAGAKVQAKAQGKTLAEGVTDAAGKCQLKISAENVYLYLKVSDVEEKRVAVQLIAHRSPGKGEEVRIELKPMRPVQVTVVDEAGKPVEGVGVVVTSFALETMKSQTNGDGKAVILIPADPSFVTVTASKAGIGYDYFSTNHRKPGELSRKPVEIPERLTFTMRGARTVRIKTVDSSGKPLKGVTVYPMPIRVLGEKGNPSGIEQFRVVTNDEGIAVFDSIPKDFTPVLQFGTTSKEFRGELLVIKPEEQKSEYVMTLEALMELSGRVLNADGTPAGGVPVTAEGTGVARRNGYGRARTTDDGRFQMLVPAEVAYLLSVDRERWVARKVGVVVREGKPVKDVELQLVEGGEIIGRVTRGTDQRPQEGVQVAVIFNGGRIPAELEALRKAEDKSYYYMQWSKDGKTDADGRYRIIVPPGEYTVMGPRQTRPARVKIEGETKVVQDFSLPGEEFYPLSGMVVDASGKPVPEASLEGRYFSDVPGVWYYRAKTGADGRFSEKREPWPMMLLFRSPDQKEQFIVRSEVNDQPAKYKLQPTVTVRGQLMDHEGMPKSGATIHWAVQVVLNEKTLFTNAFEGKAKADREGRFTLPGLAVGAEWSISWEQDAPRQWYPLAKLKIEKPGDIDLGEVRLRKPVVPMTQEQLLAVRFQSGKPIVPRLADAKVESEREYLRILLVLGDPKGELTIAMSELLKDFKDDKFVPVMANYQPMWIKAANQEEGREVAKELGLDLSQTPCPLVAVLDSDGKLMGKVSLSKGADGKLNAKEVRELMARCALPQRDAEQRLRDALAQAKQEGKRVFVQETGTWCGWCRVLSRYIVKHKEIFDANYVWVKVARDRDLHADEVMTRYRPKPGGIPWFVILDADGKPLERSELANGENIGYPAQPAEIGRFVEILKKTGPRLSEEQLKLLRADLERKK